MPEGLKVRVVTGDFGKRVQYVPTDNADRGRHVKDVSATGDLSAVPIVVVPGVGDYTCLQWAKVDNSGNPI